MADDVQEEPLPVPAQDEPDTAPPVQLSVKRSGGLEGSGLARKRSRASTGDADERTESESEGDSLFGEAPEQLLPRPTEPDERPPSLTQQQLLQRRLAQTQRLREIYRNEYWVLLEEFRARHNHVLTKGDDTAEEQAAAADVVMQPQHAFMNVQELLHQATARSRAAASLPSSARHASATPSSQAEAQSLPANGQLPQDESGEVAYARGSSSDGPAPVSAAAAATNVQPALTKPESEAPADGQPMEQHQTLPLPGQQQASIKAEPHITAKAEGPQQADAALPEFESVKAAIFNTDPSWPAASPQQLATWRAAFKAQLPEISRLEQAAAAAGGRELDREGALAVLLSHAVQYTVRGSAISLGRNTGSCGQVDVDLGLAGCAKRVSRQQATLTLQADGRFCMRNIGRRSFFVNSLQVNQGQVAPLVHLSHIDIGGLQLLFLVNQAAVQRAVARTRHHSILLQN